HPRPRQPPEGERSLHLSRDRRASDPVRGPGLYQHGREPRPAAEQGHDPALRELWRLLHAGARRHHGHDPGADPPPRHLAERPAMTRRLFHIALAAGGTGGHVIPAQALAAELSARGHHLVFFTDRRGMRYASLFPEMPVYEVASAPFRSGIVAKVVSALRMVAGTFRALRLIRMLKPAAVVGFGGYPSVPAGLAAAITGLPLCLHE